MKNATVLALLLAAIAPLLAAPADHLATVPPQTAEEKEVISLLQFDPAVINGGGQQVLLPVYNPTKYTLTSCVARFTVGKDKLERVYFSKDNAIPPFRDGVFQFDTKFLNIQPEDLKYEILKLTYKKVKE